MKHFSGKVFFLDGGILGSGLLLASFYDIIVLAVALSRVISLLQVSP